MLAGSRHISLNTEILKLDLSTLASNRLMKNGIFTVEKMLSLSEEDVRSMKGVGTKTADEIVNAIDELKGDLLGIENNTEESYMSDDTQEESANPVSVVYNSKDISLETDIVDLGLSNKASNRLIINGINTVGEMLLLTEQDVTSMRSVGKKTAEEIMSAVNDINSSLKCTGRSISKTISRDTGSGNPEDKHVSYRKDITELGLSNRALNCLTRNGISTVEEMILLSKEDIWSMSNVGVKTVEEITSKIDQINAQLEEQYRSGKTDEHQEAEASLALLNVDAADLLNLSVTDMDLSLRSKNALRRNGIFTFKDLEALTEEDLRNIPKLGAKSADEIIKVVSTLKNSEGEIAEKIRKEKDELRILWTQVRKLLAVFINTGYPYYTNRQFEIRNELLKRIKTSSSINDITLQEATDGRYFEELFRSALLNELNGRQTVTEQCLDTVFQGGLRPLKGRYVEIWLNEEFMDSEDGHYVLHCPSALEYAYSLSDERQRQSLVMKLNGFVLEQIGYKYGVSRERIRQIIIKSLQKRPMIMEDRYAGIFEKYCIDRNIFTEITGLDKTSYEYLKLTCKPGTQDISGILEEDLPENILVNAEKYVYRKYIDDCGVRVRTEKTAILVHILRTHREPVSEDVLFEEYNDFIRSHGLSDACDLEIQKRYLNSTLVRNSNVLLVSGRRLAYSPLSKEDVEELAEKIGLFELEDIEISAKYFVDRHQDVMEEYGVHDEYELHNLLKKNIVREGIEFKRQPTIVIGNGDRFMQVFELFVEEAPVSRADLAARYSEEYGADPGSVMANYFVEIDKYLDDSGIFRIDHEEMSGEEMRVMREILNEDCLPLRTVREEYQKRLPGHDIRKLNTYNFKALHYRINENVVFNTDVYPNITSLADGILLNGEADLNGRTWLLQNRIVYGRLYNYKNSWTVFEISNNRFTTIEKVNEAGLSRHELERYCELVRDFSRGRMFTIQYLRTLGFVNPYEGCGMPDKFWESVLCGYECFGKQNLGFRKVFKVGEENQFNSNLLIREIVERYGSIRLDEMRDLLEYDYGIVIRTDKILQLAKETDLFYSSARKKIYVSYERFYDEL